MDDIRELARLLHERNQIDTAISGIILRPATIGHIGEYIAAKVFDIRLWPSATYKASDGYFFTGPLAGKSVDVKFYGKQERGLDVSEEQQPDYFLVFTGLEAAAASSRGSTRPLLIEHVYLFHGQAVADSIRQRGVQFGAAASIPKALWRSAEIFPGASNAELALSVEQRQLLFLFGQDAETQQLVVANPGSRMSSLE